MADDRQVILELVQAIDALFLGLSEGYGCYDWKSAASTWEAVKRDLAQSIRQKDDQS